MGERANGVLKRRGLLAGAAADEAADRALAFISAPAVEFGVDLERHA